jgi:hypothetical protein
MTGRNEPCPCGSGRKYKNCCLRRTSPQPASTAEFLRRRIHRVTEGLPLVLSKFAQREFAATLIEEAWMDFVDDEVPFDPGSPHIQVFMPWFFYQWSPDPDQTGFPDMAARRATVAGEYLARKGKRLDALLARYLTACCGSGFSFHEIVTVDPGRGFLLRDLILEREDHVLEQSGSRNVSPGDILFAQVVRIDGLATLEGCAPILIDRRHKPSIIALRGAMREQIDTFDDTTLRVFGGELAGLYLDIAEQATMGRMPELQNTDGDPLEPHTLVFDVKDRGAVVSALDAATLGAGETIRSDDDVTLDAEGAVSNATWTWSRMGNAMHKSWDNTTLGVLSLGDDKLRVEVNSARRAARARSMLEALLGTHVTYRATSITSSEWLFEKAHARSPASDDEAQAKLMALPEVRERVTEMLMGHYRDWLDTKLPILRGRTPREAVRDRDGREAVKALVDDIAHRSPGPGPELDPAIPAMLRRELGLD